MGTGRDVSSRSSFSAAKQLTPDTSGRRPSAQPHKVLSDDQAEVTKQTKSSTADMDMDDEEAEEDGWGFEEGSGASEVDKDEFAPMTALPKDDTLANPLQAQMKAEPVAVKATQNLKSVPQPEPAASPPSPSGWGNFSDSESHSNVGDDSFDLPAAAVVSQRALPSTTSSRSVSAAPSARAVLRPRRRPSFHHQRLHLLQSSRRNAPSVNVLSTLSTWPSLP